MSQTERIERIDSLRESAARRLELVLRDDASAETHTALRDWLAESPEHAAAYRSVEHTWSRLRSGARDPAILDMRREAVRRLAPGTSTNRSSLRWAAAAAILLCGAALWILLARSNIDFSQLAWRKGEIGNPVTWSYATKAGERLTISLNDGSRVTLDTATQLEIAFSKTARAVRLSQGQALFEVAKDKARPFVVQAKEHRFIAVGTAFDVRLDREQVTVTMLEGTVRAELAAADLRPATTVTAGEQLIATAYAQDRVRRIDPERETSWRHGQLIFDNLPLGDAIDELNRYLTRHIVLSDASLANLRISGTFDTGVSSVFVEAVTAYFPIEVDHADERNVVLKARR